MTMLLFLSLSTLIIALGVVSLVIGLGIRHQIRSVVALTLGGAVMLAGLVLFYESMEHRKMESGADAFIANAGAYFNYRNTHLKTRPATPRMVIPGKTNIGQKPSGVK
ncbi:MAG: hypothetical protein ACYCXP_07545 [Leptospirillum sp.]